MKNKKQTTSIIALSALIVTFAMPGAFASAGTVESYYWQSDPEMCYLESELDDIDFENTTDESTAIISELEDSRSTYNAEMNGIDIDAEDSSCGGNKIYVGAFDLGNWTWLAQTENNADGTDLNTSWIDFNTYHGFGDESNGCTWGDYDIEWVMNHELGHGIGLKHHNHFFISSVMESSCGSEWSTLQSVDDTAIDINYN